MNVNAVGLVLIFVMVIVPILVLEYPKMSGKK